MTEPGQTAVGEQRFLSLPTQPPSAPSDLLTIFLTAAKVQVIWKNSAQGYYS